jgi:hypothetical protein
MEHYGNPRFAKCPIHSGKADLLSVKGLPRVTLGKVRTTNDFMTKSCMTWAFFPTLGKVVS